VLGNGDGSGRINELKPDENIGIGGGCGYEAECRSGAVELNKD
jgi:hypothetical protein